MGQETHLLFIDFVRAYDKVLPNLYLKRMQMEHDIILFLKEIYRKNESCIRHDGKLCESFSQSIGVKQGCPASPLLFNIFITDLLKNMSGVYCNGEEIKCLLFADDAGIIADSIESMEANVEKLEMWCNKNKMKLNFDKRGYMIVNGNTEYILLMNRQALSCVTEYTYLSLPFTASMNIMRIIYDRRDKTNFSHTER